MFNQFLFLALSSPTVKMGTMEGQLDVVEEEEEEGESVTSNYWTSLRSMSFLVPFTKSFSHTYSWLLCIFSHPIFASGVAAATAVVVVEALVALVEGRRRGKPWRRWSTLIRTKNIKTWNTMVPVDMDGQICHFCSQGFVPRQILMVLNMGNPLENPATNTMGNHEYCWSCKQSRSWSNGN